MPSEANHRLSKTPLQMALKKSQEEAAKERDRLLTELSELRKQLYMKHAPSAQKSLPSKSTKEPASVPKIAERSETRILAAAGLDTNVTTLLVACLRGMGGSMVLDVHDLDRLRESIGQGIRLEMYEMEYPSRLVIALKGGEYGD